MEPGRKLILRVYAKKVYTHAGVGWVAREIAFLCYYRETSKFEPLLFSALYISISSYMHHAFIHIL
jgi:hypothetical protein